MAGTEKSQGLKELVDMISHLPDPLICHILTHLSTKDAVRTSVLSTRWRSLWLWLPRLELDSREFPDSSTFESFGDRFFDPDRVSCIDKLKLDADAHRHTSNLESWIDAAVKRKVQRLHVLGHFPEIFLSLYNCETLVSLKLFRMPLADAEFVSLPCLKTLQFTSIFFFNEATFERLVSSCHVLEELEIIRCRNVSEPVFRVLSRSLKKLSLEKPSSKSEVVIDAPRLRFLSIDANLSKCFTITKMDSNVKLVISLSSVSGDFEEPKLSSRRNRFSSFLLGILKVRDMTMNGDTFKILCEYSKLEPLPQFGHMSRLHLYVCYSYSKWLPTVLESCPNLKSLSLECYAEYEELYSKEMTQISSSSVPQCLLSSLEFVDFKVPFSGLAPEMEVVRFFLENSEILNKLTLHLHYGYSTEDDLVKKLLKIPRSSTRCEVVFLDW